MSGNHTNGDNKPTGWTLFGRANGPLQGQEGLHVATYHYGNRTVEVYRMGLDPKAPHVAVEDRNVLARWPKMPTREEVAGEMVVGFGGSEIVH